MVWKVLVGLFMLLVMFELELVGVGWKLLLIFELFGFVLGVGFLVCEVSLFEKESFSLVRVVEEFWIYDLIFVIILSELIFNMERFFRLLKFDSVGGFLERGVFCKVFGWWGFGMGGGGGGGILIVMEVMGI